MTYLRWVYKIAIQLTSLLLRVLADVNASFLGEGITYMLRYKHKSSNEEKQQNKKTKTCAPHKHFRVVLLGYGDMHIASICYASIQTSP